jgi:hypothetical protein
VPDTASSGEALITAVMRRVDAALDAAKEAWRRVTEATDLLGSAADLVADADTALGDLDAAMRDLRRAMATGSARLEELEHDQ